MTYCAEKEIYHGSISFEQFRKIHMERWASFVEKSKDGIYIFDIDYIEELPYSQTNKLEGHEGVIRFF